MSVSVDAAIEAVAVARLDARLREERAALLAALVAEEQERRDTEQGEQARQAEQAEQGREADRLMVERDRAMADVWTRLQPLAEAVGRLCDADTALQGAALRSSRPYRSTRQSAAELAVVVLADAGLRGVEPIPFVSAAVRAKLLAEYATGTTESTARTASAATVARCTVCQSAQRGEIEQALAAGQTLRQVEGRFGISRSALSRHNEHNGAGA